ncbi:uncharacterized protein B0H18DRAFT_958317 [Fomitopsis serialis]|uniref:uncharacterized protein n=1 Tax=Fomitopsis serialis TaxID=139415 RepID=UPI002007B993|nr:uncharacterized protein B0H18DRAFT_958317 [Neoantrodia serialis]KAH9917566.1 hypothetical protein B0H18DRAFT_958317 [Neoantrodia serialis]
MSMHHCLSLHPPFLSLIANTSLDPTNNNLEEEGEMDIPLALQKNMNAGFYYFRNNTENNNWSMEPHKRIINTAIFTKDEPTDQMEVPFIACTASADWNMMEWTTVDVDNDIVVECDNQGLHCMFMPCMHGLPIALPHANLVLEPCVESPNIDLWSSQVHNPFSHQMQPTASSPVSFVWEHLFVVNFDNIPLNVCAGNTDTQLSLQQHLVGFELEAFLEVYNWTTFPISTMLAKVYSDFQMAISKGNIIPPMQTEHVAILN